MKSLSMSLTSHGKMFTHRLRTALQIKRLDISFAWENLDETSEVGGWSEVILIDSVVVVVVVVKVVMQLTFPQRARPVG